MADILASEVPAPGCSDTDEEQDATFDGEKSTRREYGRSSNTNAEQEGLSDRQIDDTSRQVASVDCVDTTEQQNAASDPKQSTDTSSEQSTCTDPSLQPPTTPPEAKQPTCTISGQSENNGTTSENVQSIQTTAGKAKRKRSKKKKKPGRAEPGTQQLATPDAKQSTNAIADGANQYKRCEQTAKAHP